MTYFHTEKYSLRFVVSATELNDRAIILFYFVKLQLLIFASSRKTVRFLNLTHSAGFL